MALSLLASRDAAVQERHETTHCNQLIIAGIRLSQVGVGERARQLFQRDQADVPDWAPGREDRKHGVQGLGRGERGQVGRVPVEAARVSRKYTLLYHLIARAARRELERRGRLVARQLDEIHVAEGASQGDDDNDE